MQIKFLQVKEVSGEKIRSADVVAKTMAQEAKVDRECFWVLHLNNRNKVIEKELVSMGIANGSLIHPREVFKKAILNGATNIITVHNHPSNHIKPSPEDNKIWNILDKAGEILGIKVLDHIIITPSGSYYSKQEEKQ